MSASVKGWGVFSESQAEIEAGGTFLRIDAVALSLRLVKSP